MATGSRVFDSAAAGEVAELLAALAPRLASHAGPAVISFDLPAVDPLRLWRAFPDAETTYWKAPRGPRLVTIGRVDGFAAGPGVRPQESASSLARLRERLLHLDGRTGELCGEPVRLPGGGAFDAGGDRGVWTGFGGGGFVLPELCLEENGETVRCRMAVACPSEDGVEPAMTRLGVFVRELAGGDGRGRDSGREPRDGPDPWPVTTIPDGWVDLVEQARREIRDRRLRKVVICRRASMQIDPRLDPAQVLAGLSSRTNEYVFGLRRGGMTFLGASPELLMELKGRRLRTEALAGTRELDPQLRRPDALARAAEELFGSGKEVEEHALVVRGIVEALDPLVRRRSLPPWPEVRGLAGLAHLCSRIEAELKDGVGPFEILAALHPTPAVGGLPRAEALRFLSRSEPVERGWYAGPVGWVTTDGDAEIAVGIRSALLSAGTAWLYAGAGIVLASDPAEEYRETGAKLRRLSSALGVSEIPG